MGRFRSFLRRVAKPAAMMAVAGMLAISLTVTTTQKAEANPLVALPVVMAAEAAAGAAIPLVMPSLAATVLAVTPVGWVIAGGVAVAALALGAYYTKDYWLPYVTGAFGGAKDKDTAATGGQARARITGYTRSADGNTFTITYAWSGYAGTAWYQQFGAIGKCKRTSDGAIYYASKNGYWSMDSGNNNFTYSIAQTPCPAGYTTEGWKLGGGGSTSVQGGSWTPSLNAGGVAAYFDGSSQYQFGASNIIEGGTWGTATFDPRGADVHYKTTVECISDGGVKSMISAEFTGNEGGAKFPSCAAAGKGHGTGVNKIEGYAPTAPGVPGTVPETIWSTAAPAVDPNYSKCDQGKPGQGCEMRITIDGKPCVVGQWECVNWSELANDPATAPRVGCTYGPYTLALEMCSIMEPAYRPGGGPLTEANVDGNPSTRNNNDLSGQPFTPETKPSTVPGGAGAPSPSDTAAATCWPQGWAIFNPMWIYDSLNCAFVPKADLQQRVQNTVNTAGTLPPMSWFNAVNMTAPGGASCPDWTVHVGGFSENVICGSSFTDALRGSRNLVFTMLAGAMVWPLIRSLWYASIPFIRVSPGSSK